MVPPRRIERVVGWAHALLCPMGVGSLLPESLLSSACTSCSCSFWPGCLSSFVMACSDIRHTRLRSPPAYSTNMKDATRPWGTARQSSGLHPNAHRIGAAMESAERSHAPPTQPCSSIPHALISPPCSLASCTTCFTRRHSHACVLERLYLEPPSGPRERCPARGRALGNPLTCSRRTSHQSLTPHTAGATAWRGTPADATQARAAGARAQRTPPPGHVQRSRQPRLVLLLRVGPDPCAL